ncbi:MAG TPA: hypothetical protein VGD94_14120 [Vicinamibacterales bacterium]
MASFSTDVLIWTHYFEKFTGKLDPDRLARWDLAMEESFGSAINAACEEKGIRPTKTNRSQILALAIITRGSELRGRVRAAAAFYRKNVLDSGIE